MKINCIIVEDEPLALERTKNYVLRLPFLQLLSSFDSGVDALVYLQSNAVDLIFLDINVGELSGISLLESFHVSAQVIITTAYHEYALKGYELNVSDYLLKPFSFERFAVAVDKVQRNLQETIKVIDQKFIFIKTEHRLEKLLLDEVFFIEGMRDYRKIHTACKSIMTLQTFRELEQEIQPSIICRVHKSFMVSISKIEIIEKDIIKIGAAFIPVSETYKKSFLKIIGKFKN